MFTGRSEVWKVGEFLSSWRNFPEAHMMNPSDRSFKRRGWVMRGGKEGSQPGRRKNVTSVGGGELPTFRLNGGPPPFSVHENSGYQKISKERV